MILLSGLRSRGRSRSRSRPESVVLTGVGVGVGKFSSVNFHSDSGPESVTALFHYFLPSHEGNRDGNWTLLADCRHPRWFVVYGALIAGVAFISGSTSDLQAKITSLLTWLAIQVSSIIIIGNATRFVCKLDLIYCNILWYNNLKLLEFPIYCNKMIQ